MPQVYDYSFSPQWLGYNTSSYSSNPTEAYQTAAAMDAKLKSLSAYPWQQPAVANVGTGTGAVMQPNPTQMATVKNNETATPDIAKLAEMINGIQQAAQQKANQGRIPGGKALEEQSSKTIGSALKGEIDPGTLAIMQQQAAERGVNMGSPLGANTNAAYLRAVYDTSENRIKQGQEWLTAAEQRNPAAPLFDPTSMLITPVQQSQLGLEAERLALQKYLAELQAQTQLKAASIAHQPAYGPRGYSMPAGGGSSGNQSVTPSLNWADLFGTLPQYGIGESPSGRAVDQAIQASNQAAQQPDFTYDELWQLDPSYFYQDPALLNDYPIV